MSEQRFSILLYAIASDVINRLCAGGMSLRSALKSFYASRLYAALENRDTGLWHEPTSVLLSLFDIERRTGKFPADWSA